MLCYAVLLELVFCRFRLRGRIFAQIHFCSRAHGAKNIQMIELALTQGADIQALDDNGVGAAAWASREGYIALSEALCASGAK